MDASQSFLLEASFSLNSSMSLSKLLDPSTTPEKALQLLQSHYHLLKEHDSVIVFLKYMRYIVTRLPDACVDGIWEEILRSTIMYSKDFAKDFCKPGKQIGHLRRLYASEVPSNGIQESQWLVEVLSDYNKCPNSYIRLELFRLIRVFQKDCENMPWERLSTTFIHTVSDIHPHQLYPSGDMEEIMCGVLDFNYIIDKFNKSSHMDKMILVGFTEQFKHKHNMIVESKEVRFIFHCIQLMGVFAVRAGLISDSQTQESQILGNICYLFYKVTNFLKIEDLISGMSPLIHFQNLVSRPPFRPYVDESIGNITAAIINNKQSHKEKSIMAVVRDIIAWNLDVYSKPCDLPKLLLFRQIYGTKLISKYSLLLRELRIFYLNSKIEGSDNRDDINIDYEDSDDESSDNEDSDGEGNDVDIDDEEMNIDEINEEINFLEADQEN